VLKTRLVDFIAARPTIEAWPILVHYLSLENILAQVDLLISTTEPMPENRTERCRELLRAASALVDDLLKQAA
jgi:hypothetical protein